MRPGAWALALALVRPTAGATCQLQFSGLSPGTMRWYEAIDFNDPRTDSLTQQIFAALGSEATAGAIWGSAYQTAQLNYFLQEVFPKMYPVGRLTSEAAASLSFTVGWPDTVDPDLDTSLSAFFGTGYATCQLVSMALANTAEYLMNNMVISGQILGALHFAVPKLRLDEFGNQPFKSPYMNAWNAFVNSLTLTADGNMDLRVVALPTAAPSAPPATPPDAPEVLDAEAVELKREEALPRLGTHVMPHADQAAPARLRGMLGLGVLAGAATIAAVATSRKRGGLFSGAYWRKMEAEAGPATATSA